MKKFSKVVVGGTFDHFHKGHKEFLRFAFSLAEKVSIGITSEKYILGFKEKEELEGFGQRFSSIQNFLAKEGLSERVEIVQIDDVFGPTLSKEFYADAIVVSRESRKGADKINSRRSQKGMTHLTVILFPSLKGNDGQPISSTRIRNGEIDREGECYIRPFWLKTMLKLPDRMREKLGKPGGVLYEDFEKLKSIISKKNSFKFITCGDIVTKSFIESCLFPAISIIDFKVARKIKFSSIGELGFNPAVETIKIKNPAGTVTSSLFNHALILGRLVPRNSTVVLMVDGEEDLAVLPFVLALPLGYSIFYGQPGRGVVEIKVDERTKNEAKSILDEFEANTRGH